MMRVLNAEGAEKHYKMCIGVGSRRAVHIERYGVYFHFICIFLMGKAGSGDVPCLMEHGFATGKGLPYARRCRYGGS